MIDAMKQDENDEGFEDFTNSLKGTYIEDDEDKLIKYEGVPYTWDGKTKKVRLLITGKLDADVNIDVNVGTRSPNYHGGRDPCIQFDKNMKKWHYWAFCLLTLNTDIVEDPSLIAHKMGYLDEDVQFTDNSLQQDKGHVTIEYLVGEDQWEEIQIHPGWKVTTSDGKTTIGLVEYGNDKLSINLNTKGEKWKKEFETDSDESDVSLMADVKSSRVI